MEVLKVITPGLFTTLQDLGRFGFRKQGVPVCGALDELSMRCANYILKNAPSAPVLEITLQGPTLRFLNHTAFALSGADLNAKLNDEPCPVNEACFAAKGDVLSFGSRVSGSRCYLAIRGGFLGKSVLNSVATHVRSGWGGINGTTLATGQKLSCGKSTHRRSNRLPDLGHLGKPGVHSDIRIIQGPEGDSLAQELTYPTWRVSSESDRAGIRLQGKAVRTSQVEMISSPADVGTIQLPKNGLPLILMNDGPGVGGYPRIASVIRADLPKIAQLAPHDPVSFKMVSQDEALLLHTKYVRILNKLDSSLSPP